MAIVEALIQLAGKLEMRVIAESIETEDQGRESISAGCLLGQGYLFSEAVDRAVNTALLLGDKQHPPVRGGPETEADILQPGKCLDDLNWVIAR